MLFVVVRTLLVCFDCFLCFVICCGGKADECPMDFRCCAFVRCSVCFISSYVPFIPLFQAGPMILHECMLVVVCVCVCVCVWCVVCVSMCLVIRSPLFFFGGASDVCRLMDAQTYDLCLPARLVRCVVRRCEDSACLF